MSTCRERNSLLPNSQKSSKTSPERSKEELDEHFRSTKRIKESHMDFPKQNEGENAPRASYREKLAGVIPGAFEETFRIDDHHEDDTDDDVGPEEEDGSPRVLLTKEEKRQIRAPWRESLIVKLFGRSLVYRFFKQRLMALWRPLGTMECVDIGNGFFVVTFHNREDRTKVLRDGP